MWPQQAGTSPRASSPLSILPVCSRESRICVLSSVRTWMTASQRSSRSAWSRPRPSSPSWPGSHGRRRWMVGRCPSNGSWCRLKPNVTCRTIPIRWPSSWPRTLTARTCACWLRCCGTASPPACCASAITTPTTRSPSGPTSHRVWYRPSPRPCRTEHNHCPHAGWLRAARQPGRVLGCDRRNSVARLGEGRDLDNLQPVGNVPNHLVAVLRRSKEPHGSAPLGTHQLLLDSADRPHRARCVDRARARDVDPSGERPGRELVVDGKGEHHPCGRSADVPRVDADLDGEVEGNPKEDTHHRVALGGGRPDAEKHVLASPAPRQDDVLARLLCADRRTDPIRGRDGGAVDGDEDVARLQDSLGR